MYSISHRYVCFLLRFVLLWLYHQTSNISRSLVGNKIVDHSDVVGAAPTTSSFSTQNLASMDWAKTTARQDEEHLSFGLWCVLYQRFDGMFYLPCCASDVIPINMNTIDLSKTTTHSQTQTWAYFVMYFMYKLLCLYVFMFYVYRFTK